MNSQETLLVKRLLRRSFEKLNIKGLTDGGGSHIMRDGAEKRKRMRWLT